MGRRRDRRVDDGFGGRNVPPGAAPLDAVMRTLRGKTFDLTAIRSQGYAYERLDQLTMELLLGVR